MDPRKEMQINYAPVVKKDRNLMLKKIVSQKIMFFTLTVLTGIWISSSASGESKMIKMSTTTSTENSGQP